MQLVGHAPKRQPLPTALAVVVALLAGACGSGDGGSQAVAPPEPAIVPETAVVAVVESELVYSADAALAPSGAGVAPADGQWCLEDDAGVRCVAAAAEESAAHGVVWRRDESAIAVTWGAQNPISVVDFEAGTSVETDLGSHRLLAWSPDGSDLLGLALEQEGELLRLDPETLEPEGFASLPPTVVPQLIWATPDIVWGSNPQRPEVFTLSPGGEPEIIEGGLGEQLLVSVTADGRLALATDDEVERGFPGPDDTALTIFDREQGRSVGIVLPDGVEQDAPVDAVLSPDGAALLVLHKTEDGLALTSASIDGETLTASGWTTLTEWTSTDADRPIIYGSNGIIEWDGGSTAWAIADSGRLLKITFS